MVQQRVELHAAFGAGVLGPGEEAQAQRVGLTLCDLPLAQVVTEALSQTWTRDPFDRLIVATAAARAAPLVTKDETIRAHYRHAVWE